MERAIAIPQPQYSSQSFGFVGLMHTACYLKLDCTSITGFVKIEARMRSN
jgi:hypothetical protein